MDYKIVVTEDAEADLDRYISYLLFGKKNKQAAKNVLEDFEKNKEDLRKAAGSLKLCDNPGLKQLGYRRIDFRAHRYFMLYRIDGDKAVVDNIFHELQDYESKMI